MAAKIAGSRNVLDELHSISDVTEYIDDLVLAVGRYDAASQKAGASEVAGVCNKIREPLLKKEPHDVV